MASRVMMGSSGRLSTSKKGMMSSKKSPQQQNYENEREKSKENRELLLLGENTRLREKLNRVIDEAEATISELAYEHADLGNAGKHKQ